MLTRLIRIQLVVFSIVSIIGMALMVVSYLQLPTLLGLGKITVTLELPNTGGLYQFSNVTYRGVQMGKVTAVALTPTGAKATLKLNTSPRIPANLQAEVRSVSAVGEQYVDLRPRADTGPYLQDGSVIPLADTTIPQSVGPMLDQVSALVSSIPKEKLSVLLDESFNGFNDAGYDLGSLADSSAKVTSDISRASNHARALVDDSRPLLDSQADTTDAIRTWAHSLADVTQTVAADDQPVRTLLTVGQRAANEVSSLLAQVKPTLPVLLANLVSIGRVLVTYNPALEQMLVLLPVSVASTQSFGPMSNPTGLPLADFAITTGDPPACTVGFLPQSEWRSPAATTTVDTPDGLYCKLPQDAPLAVRGARNYPCMGHPGKRAPTVEICDSDQPYLPLALRQHALGPSPIDPNLISQGVAPDSRVDSNDHIFGPMEGTPPAPSAGPPGPPPATEQTPPPPSVADQAPPPPPPVVATAPAAFATDHAGLAPSVAIAKYNPKTGVYVTPDGLVYRQSDVVKQGAAESWKDLFPT